MNVTQLAGISREVHARLRRFFDTPLGDDATPLEICQAVLDEVEQRIQPIGRGRRVFPFTRLQVRVLAYEATRPAVEATFEPLAARVQERLAELRCEPTPGLEVELTYLDESPKTWAAGQLFEVEYVAAAARAGSPRLSSSPVPSPAVLRVTVVEGVATAPEFTFGEATVSIGRSADPTDERGRIRRNRIAFVDGVDGVNETVGRAHARVRFDPDTREYRVFDEGSSNGTSVLRDGEVIAVHRRDPRGVRIRTGDEIQVGRAVLRVDIEC
ncbi:MAG: FHA domain-containing protein [Luteitalea sp.]